MNNDDWITLYGGGQISRWKFWQSSRCPITNCGKLFNDRESTKIHFRKHHVKKTTYCAACNGPVICSAHSTDMESHYRRVHPDVPFQFDQTKIKQEPRQIEVIWLKCTTCGHFYSFKNELFSPYFLYFQIGKSIRKRWWRLHKRQWHNHFDRTGKSDTVAIFQWIEVLPISKLSRRFWTSIGSHQPFQINTFGTRHSLFAVLQAYLYV